jgi:hypothetical protein
MVGYIRTYSGQTQALIPLVDLQTTATKNMTTQADNFGVVVKGAADYTFWTQTRIGDAAEIVIGKHLDLGAASDAVKTKHWDLSAADDIVKSAHYNLADAGNYAAGILRSLPAPVSAQSGLSYVPHSMLVNVHPQEAILTAAQAREWRSGRSGGSTGQGHVNYGRVQLVFPNVRDMAGADRVYRGLQ